MGHTRGTAFPPPSFILRPCGYCRVFVSLRLCHGHVSGSIERCMWTFNQRVASPCCLCHTRVSAENPVPAPPSKEVCTARAYVTTAISPEMRTFGDIIVETFGNGGVVAPSSLFLAASQNSICGTACPCHHPDNASYYFTVQPSRTAETHTTCCAPASASKHEMSSAHRKLRTIPSPRC